MQTAMRVHVPLSVYVTMVCTMLVVYSREDVASFFAVFFYLPVDTTSSLAPHKDLPPILLRFYKI